MAYADNVLLLAEGDRMNSGFFSPDNASTAILVSGSSMLITLGALIVLSSELSTLSVAIGLPSDCSIDVLGGADGTEGKALGFNCPFCLYCDQCSLECLASGKPSDRRSGKLM
jgi:hypothetical protein